MSTVTQTIEVSDVRNEIDGLLDRVHRGETRLLVEKSGVPMAMIISLEEWGEIDESKRRREDPFAILDELGAAFADVPPEEIEREAEKAVAEVRAEMRAERLAAAAAAGE
jgi:prevent-host-death family protein